MIVAPNSPIPRANESAQPAPSPPDASGTATRKKRSGGAGAERAGRVGQCRVDDLEGRDRGADVERAGDEGDASTTATCGEGDRRCRARSACRRAGRSGRRRRGARCLRPPAAARAAARPRHEQRRGASTRFVAIQYAVGVPKRRIKTIEIAFVSSVTTNRVDRGRVGAERVEELVRRDAQEDGRDREQQERERDARRDDDRRPKGSSGYGFVFGSAMKPAFFEAPPGPSARAAC